MRLWTLHPAHLDVRGLTALWREGLLAQKVLAGATRGYRAHPQLQRFSELEDPLGGIRCYLHAVWAEAARRGYRFDASKIGLPLTQLQIAATRGQLWLEWDHLKAKLNARSPSFACASQPSAHPMFILVDGPPASWERLRLATPQPGLRSR